MSRVTAVGLMVAGLLAGGARAPAVASHAEESLTTEALKARVEAMKAPRVAWREIPWKPCLLDGLRESRGKGKPVLLWVFIYRPADDARC